MLVFIDESGDPGFEMSRGSSPVFSVAMVIFNDGADALKTEVLIRAALIDLRAMPEFRFNKCSNGVRDGFFEIVGVARSRNRCA